MTDSKNTNKARFTGLLVMAAVVSAVSALLYGYDTGIISGALLQISKQFKIGSSMEQVIAASILFGAVIGALVCSRLSERLGRQKTIVFIAVIFTLGAVSCALAPSPWLLSLGRILLGFAVGGGTQTVPMYVAELAPAPLRGRLVLTFQVGIGVGIVVSTIVGATQAIDWRIEVGSAAVPALIMLVLMLRLPESPRWLVTNESDDAAREVLKKIRRSDDDVEPELDAIIELVKEEREAKTSGFGGLRKRWVRPALIVGCGIAIFTQLSGIEMII